jgi:hypothetical protein
MPRKYPRWYTGKLIAETESIMDNGLLVKSAFNAAQLGDESSKHQLRQESPDLAEVLDALEDHDLMRGRLRAIRLDRETLRDRAASFQRLFDPKAQRYDAIAAALLTAAEVADYTDRGCCLRVDALRIVADQQQHLGRSARGHPMRLQQFGGAGGCQDFQASVVLLDLGI